MSLNQSQATSRGGESCDLPSLPRSKKNRRLFLPEKSFPMIFRGVESVQERESGADPMEGVHVSHPHFRRGKNSEN